MRCGEGEGQDCWELMGARSTREIGHLNQGMSLKPRAKVLGSFQAFTDSLWLIHLAETLPLR